jgi:hypothetical protein
MSDTPSDQVPDSVSTEALFAALGRGFPDPTALQAFHFGDTQQHEGLDDLVVLLTLIFSQKEPRPSPSVVQTIGAIAYISDLLNRNIREATNASLQALEQDFERVVNSDPGRVREARTILAAVNEDARLTFATLDKLRSAAFELQGKARQGATILEMVQTRGKSPDPCRRQRFVSDQFLNSIGIDREAFDSYFKNRAGC